MVTYDSNSIFSSCYKMRMSNKLEIGIKPVKPSQTKPLMSEPIEITAGLVWKKCLNQTKPNCLGLLLLIYPWNHYAKCPWSNLHQPPCKHEVVAFNKYLRVEIMSSSFLLCLVGLNILFKVCSMRWDLSFWSHISVVGSLTND